MSVLLFKDRGVSLGKMGPCVKDCSLVAILQKAGNISTVLPKYKTSNKERNMEPSEVMASVAMLMKPADLTKYSKDMSGLVQFLKVGKKNSR